MAEAKIETKVENNNICVVHIVGEVDSGNLPELEGVLKPIIDDVKIKHIVFNCNDLIFIDSKVVGYIAYLHTTLSNVSRFIAFAQTNETINDILMLVGLTTIIPQFNTTEDALSNLH